MRLKWRPSSLHERERRGKYLPKLDKSDKVQPHLVYFALSHRLEGLVRCPCRRKSEMEGGGSFLAPRSNKLNERTISGSVLWDIVSVGAGCFQAPLFY